MKALPTNIKIMRGETRTERLNPNEPRPAPVMPECPEYIKGRARGIWERLGAKIVKLGILTEIDGEAFGLLCESLAKYWDFQEGLNDGGYVFESDSGYRQQHPEVAVALKYFDRARALLAEFGLTPSSRSRLSVPKDDKDEFDDLLGG